jgi:hypothetical protein
VIDADAAPLLVVDPDKFVNLKTGKALDLDSLARGGDQILPDQSK